MNIIRKIVVLYLLNLVFVSCCTGQSISTLAQVPEVHVVIDGVSQLETNRWQANSGDQAWLLLCSALVLLMTPGLALFYGGLVSHKNVINILMQCMMCMGLVTVLWVTVGFGLAFGSDILGGFAGNPFSFFLGTGVAFDRAWEIVPGVEVPVSQASFMLFQCMFAIIAPGLMIGAFAERMKFGAFTIFAGVWLLVVYCPVAHWVWYGPAGFFGLATFDANSGVPTGALDFAGGTVVHINAGIAALVCCLYLGKRKSSNQPHQPHNMPMAVLGTGLLWFGWFGFNGGSSLMANDQAVRAVVTTHIAAAAAAFAWALLEWYLKGRPTALGTISGAISGLVSITPAAGYVDVVSALWIGILGSVIGYFFVNVVKVYFAYDDTLDVFGIHGMAGVWGAIATGIFAIPGFGDQHQGGLIFGNPIQVWLQLKATIFTIVYSGCATWLLLLVVDRVVGLRTNLQCDCAGMDQVEHAEEAYILSSTCQQCEVIDVNVLRTLTECLHDLKTEPSPRLYGLCGRVRCP